MGSSHTQNALGGEMWIRRIKARMSWVQVAGVPAKRAKQPFKPE